MTNEEIEKEWRSFVDYANKNGYLHYVGDLSFVCYKTGDTLKLVGKGKVTVTKKFAVEDAEIIGEKE